MNLLLLRIKYILHKIPAFFKCSYLNLRFPFLRGRGGKALSTRSFYYSIPKAWRKAFGMQFCKELLREAKADSVTKIFRFYDIKEKFGYLDCFYDGGTPAIDKVIMKYECISEHTCIECGRQADYISQGWIAPYCKDCLKKKKIISYEPYNKWYGYLLNNKENKTISDGNTN